MPELILFGAGEHASVVADAALSSGWRLRGFLDPDACSPFANRFGVTRLGDDESVGDVVAEFPDSFFVLGVGGLGCPGIREEIVSRVQRDEVKWATIIHSRATVAATATIGAGAVVFAGAVVNAGAVVGPHAVVNTGSIIEHDVQVGNGAQVAPGVIVGGGVTIGERAYLGLGCLVRDHVTIGAGAIVGMGAVVVSDVPPNVTVVGVPARRMTA